MCGVTRDSARREHDALKSQRWVGVLLLLMLLLGLMLVGDT